MGVLDVFSGLVVQKTPLRNLRIGIFRLLVISALSNREQARSKYAGTLQESRLRHVAGSFRDGLWDPGHRPLLGHGDTASGRSGRRLRFKSNRMQASSKYGGTLQDPT